MAPTRTATVFSFHTFEEGAERPKLSRFKATRETVRALHGKIAEGTAETVDASSLDEDGRYRRIASAWGELS